MLPAARVAVTTFVTIRTVRTIRVGTVWTLGERPESTPLIGGVTGTEGVLPGQHAASRERRSGGLFRATHGRDPLTRARSPHADSATSCHSSRGPHRLHGKGRGGRAAGSPGPPSERQRAADSRRASAALRVPRGR